MKLAIMQPYLFPYLGYFQLISSADHFVIHDDVQYIKGGWINRNRLQKCGREMLFTFSVKQGGSKLKINERSYSSEWLEDKSSILNRLKDAYGKAPCFSDVFSLVQKAMDIPTPNVALFNTEALKLTTKSLGIDTPITLSSDLKMPDELRAESRVLEICRRFKADTYINAVGGKELYSLESFKNEGVNLLFLKARNVPYSQGHGGFLPFLSILDVMMWNSTGAVRDMLGEFDFV